MTIKKLITLLICFTLAFGGSAFSFADTVNTANLTMNKYGFDYTLEDYLSVLPFKMSTKDTVKSNKLFNDIGLAFEKNQLKKAEELLQAFYDVVGKYWLGKDTLTTLLPFKDMMAFGGRILTDTQKQSFQKEFDKLAELKKKKDLEGYFAQIKKIHFDYYNAIGSAVGDVNNELQLVQYIKGADQLTDQDLVDYTFEDYLSILPFEINTKDFRAGNKIFKEIGEKLKADDTKAAKLLTGKLNDLLAPYWISKDTLDTVVPHKIYQEQIISSLSRKNQLEMNAAYEDVLTAQKEGDFDKYFASIDTYFHKLALAIKSMYADYFDEIVFIRS